MIIVGILKSQENKVYACVKQFLFFCHTADLYMLQQLANETIRVKDSLYLKLAFVLYFSKIL